MIPAALRLTVRHPLRLVLGGARVARQLAQRSGCVSCAIWLTNVEAWALEAIGVSHEIVRDAGNGALLVDEVARDGKISAKEAAQLRRAFAEIGTEAQEGRIL